MLGAELRFERGARLGPVGAFDRQRMQPEDDAFGLPDFFAVLEAAVDQRVQHHPARIGLVHHVGELPALAKSLQKSVEVLMTAEDVEEAPQALERLRRPFETLRG